MGQLEKSVVFEEARKRMGRVVGFAGEVGESL